MRSAFTFTTDHYRANDRTITPTPATGIVNPKRRRAAIQAGWLVFLWTGWPTIPALMLSVWNHRANDTLMVLAFMIAPISLGLACRWQARLASTLDAALQTWKSNSHID